MLAKIFDTAALPLILDVAWKGTIVLVVAFVLAQILRRASAGNRHLVWALAVMVLLALPLTSFIPPLWHLPLTSGSPVWEQVAADSDLKLGQLLFAAEADGKLARKSPVQSAQPQPRPVLMASRGNTLPAALPTYESPIETPAPASPPPIGMWITLIWLAGCLVSVAWLLGGWFCIARLAQRCQLIRGGRLCAQLARITDVLRIRRRVQLVMCSQRAMPMTWGVVRPVVLLPEEARHWSVDRLCMVMLHELGHVKRWDCLVQMLAHLARGLYWFHPLAWLAARQLRVEQENACDDLVLDKGASGPDYAEHLLAVTAGLSSTLWTAPVALGMSRSDNLRRRLVRLLDAGSNHQPVQPRTVFLGTIIALALAIPLGTASLSPISASGQAEQTKDKGQEPAAGKDDALLKRLNEVMKALAKYYVSPVDEKALAESAVKGLLQGLNDPYTTYLSPEELNRLTSETKGTLTGIGAQLKFVDGQLAVVTPLDDSPALLAGIRPGDFIEAIDGKSTRGLSLAEAVKHILGPAGSVVKLKVVHTDGVMEELPITRGEVRIRTVTGFQRGPDGVWHLMLDPVNKVGYLQVHQFAGNTTAEMREAIEIMQKSGMKGLILDLRACPGGLLDQSVDVCKLFLAKGTILSTRGADKEEKTWTADGKSTLGDFPLVVLINDQTASAAEIVAGALRDHNRAVLLGSRTYGKGAVKMLVKLDGGGALLVTTANQYLPSGRNIQKRPGEKSWGVDPTDGFYVPLTPAQSEALRKDVEKRVLIGLAKEEQPKSTERLTPKVIEKSHADPQLAAALRTMVARITGGEFIKVGKDLSTLMNDQVLQIQELRKTKEQIENLQRSLSQLEARVVELQQAIGKEKSPEK
jgi:carboxyl-terminal processing protease